MYLKSIHSVNVGPIEDAKINFPFNEDGTPKPVVIVGENGTGKSVMLSNIVDSFYEMAAEKFNNAGKSDDYSIGRQYYKAVMEQEIHTGKDYMYSYIQYEDLMLNNERIEYIFKSGNISEEEFCSKEDIKHKNFQWNDKENYKKIKIESSKVETIFNENVICYFPPGRYERPNWMGNKYYDSNKFEHPSVQERFSGRLYNPILVLDVTSETLQWLLDVIADSRCDVKYDKNNNWNIIHCDTVYLQMMNIARHNVEKIMGKILEEEVYFGLNYRTANGSRFNINSVNGTLRIPTLNALSTGQSALFNMFATIIRYADSNDINKSINLKEITGIVVIDEIELHLHSNLQREVLPKLLKQFPKVQFIISSHSPLFLLGMDEEYKSDGYEIYEMPSAMKITAEKFSEFGKAYNYLTETETYQQAIRQEIQKHQGKPLIITEGATDWKHIKAAFKNLKSKSEYQDYAKIDFEFLEYEPDNKINDKKQNKYDLGMGNQNLKLMCQYFAKLKQPQKLIFIADADDEGINNNLGGKNNLQYKNWGNNVFSFVLPIPEHRKSTPSICIEHYYTDDEIKTSIEIDGKPRRLYIGNEFDDYGVGIKEDIICRDLNSCGKCKINIIDGCNNKPVCALRDETKTNLALPKMKFAEGILNKVPEFANINFDNFHLIFDVIKQILNEPLV